MGITIGIEVYGALGEKGGVRIDSEETGADGGVPWRIEVTGELGQRLLFIIFCLLDIILAKGCTAGKRIGLLEGNVGTFCEWDSGVVGITRWQRWSISHRPLVCGEDGGGRRRLGGR